MKNIIMDINILHKHYIIIYDDVQKNATALVIGNDEKLNPVIAENELEFLNEIIDKNIRRRLFNVGEISFKERNYIKYRNRYNGKYYFSSKENNKDYLLPYEGNEEIYDYYNPSDIIYYSLRKNSRNSQLFSSYDDVDDVEETEYYQDIPTYTRKKNGIAKIIAISIAGIIGVVTITACGLKLIGKSNLPHITGTEQITVEQEQVVDDNSSINENNQIEEEQQALKQKYDQYQNELFKQGLEPWEVAVELENIKFFFEQENDNNSEKIYFYYDAESKKISYIFDENYKRESIEESFEAKKENEHHNITSYETVEELIYAVNNNKYLSDEEKQFLIELCRDKWANNIEAIKHNRRGEYYDDYFNLLEIGYSNKKNDNETYNTHNNPYTDWDAYYSRKENKIYVLNAQNFEEAKKDTTLPHEVGHVVRRFWKWKRIIKRRI